MKKLFLILFFSFISTNSSATARFGSDTWVSPDHPKNYGSGWICIGDCGNPPEAFYVNETGPSNLMSIQQARARNDRIEKRRFKSLLGPRIFQAFCSTDSNQDISVLERKTPGDYWDTYDGALVNSESLKEFFRITRNHYNSECDDFFSQYMKLPFHKTVIFAYDKNILDHTGYWSMSLNSRHRNEAEGFGLKACEDFHKAFNVDSFNCAVLFTNNQIISKEYLALAKKSGKEYMEAIMNFENKISEVTVSQNELSDMFN